MNKTLTYHWHGEYLLPDLALNDSGVPIGRYGRMRRAFLREHCPIEYSRLVLTEQLFPHLREVDEAARTRFETIVDSEAAHEIILSELVYR